MFLPRAAGIVRVLGEARLPGKTLGPFAHQQAVRRAADRLRQKNGVANAAHARHRAQDAGGIHHRRVQFEGLAVQPHDRAAAGIEAAVVFQPHHAVHHRIDGRAARAQRVAHRARRRLAAVFVLLGVARAAVHGDGPAGAA